MIDDTADPDALVDVELRVRRRADGGRCVVLVAAVTLVDADVVHRLADRLHAVARSLEGDAADG